MSSPIENIQPYEGSLNALKDELTKKIPDQSVIDIKIEKVAQEMSAILDAKALEKALDQTKSYLLNTTVEIRNDDTHKNEVDNLMTTLKSKIYIFKNQFSTNIQSSSKPLNSISQVPNFVYKKHVQTNDDFNYYEIVKLMNHEGSAILELEKYLKEEKAKRLAATIPEKLNTLEFFQNLKKLYEPKSSSDEIETAMQKAAQAAKGDGEYLKKLKDVIAQLDQTLLENKKNREEFTYSYVGNFLKSTLHFQLFFKRIAKVYTETAFEEMNAKEAAQFLQTNPDHILITKAILEDLQYVMFDNIHLFIENFFATKEKIWMVKAAELYQNLPVIARHAIELQIGEKIDQSQGVEAQEKGKNRIEDLFNQKIEASDAESIHEILFDYQKAHLLHQPNLTPFCDESIKGLIFKISDEKGMTRGFVMGTSHAAPEEFVKFRKAIRNAYYQSTVLIAERDYELSERKMQNEIEGAKKEKLGLMDMEFLLQAKREGKPILGAESEEINHLKERLNQAGGNEVMEDSAYDVLKKGDLSGVAEMIKKMYPPEKNREFYRIFFHERNLIQTDHMDQFLRQNPQEIAFGEYGVSHLVDTQYSTGILTSLKQKGWKVDQI